MKIKQSLLLSIGLGIFIYLIHRVGWSTIAMQFHMLHWKFLILFLVYALVYALDTLGWKFSFKTNVCPVSFWRLYWVRVAGEAVNNTTPTGYMGGEPVKASLLKRDGLSTPESLASLVVAKTTMTLSEILFIVIGLIFAFVNFPIPFHLRLALILVLVLLTVLVLLFLFFQDKGLFSGIAKGLMHLNVGKSFFSKIMHRIHELELHIAHFYGKDKKRFMLSFFFHFLGWWAGVLEIYLILYFLHIPFNFQDALIIETLHQMIRGLAFIVPANIGTQEGGSFFIFTLLGFNSALGVSVSLIRRIRELSWAAIGWGLLIFWKTRVAVLPEA